MIRAIVLSDTHIPEVATDLPQQVYDEFSNGVDFIFHAGDFEEIFIYKKLDEIAPVIAVQGNMDSRELKSILPQNKVIEREGFRIGIIHGYGSPRETINNIKLQFRDENLDIVIFGHTHSPLNRKMHNTIYFNPGSPTDKIFAPYNSFGIIEINNFINTEIIKIED